MVNNIVMIRLDNIVNNTTTILLFCHNIVDHIVISLAGEFIYTLPAFPRLFWNGPPTSLSCFKLLALRGQCRELSASLAVSGSMSRMNSVPGILSQWHILGPDLLRNKLILKTLTLLFLSRLTEGIEIDSHIILKKYFTVYKITGICSSSKI